MFNDFKYTVEVHFTHAAMFFFEWFHRTSFIRRSSISQDNFFLFFLARRCFAASFVDASSMLGVRWRIRFIRRCSRCGMPSCVVNVPSGIVFVVSSAHLTNVDEVQMLFFVVLDRRIDRYKSAFAHQTFTLVDQNRIDFTFTRLMKINKEKSSFTLEFFITNLLISNQFTSFISNFGQLVACCCSTRSAPNGSVHQGHVKNSFGCALTQCTCSNVIESDKYAHNGHSNSIIGILVYNKSNEPTKKSARMKKNLVETLALSSNPKLIPFRDRPFIFGEFSRFCFSTVYSIE